LGRYFTAKLADLSGQSVIVENRPGANANIALSLVANAKPDGYTILFAANSNMAGSRFLFKELSFDTIKDFVPAASFARIAFVMTVGANSPIKSVAELTAYLKSHQHNRYGVTNQTAILATEYYKQLVGGRGDPGAVSDRTGGAAGRRQRYARFHDHGWNVRGRPHQAGKNPGVGSNDRATHSHVA
jgi:Uncharacterized protein conserved in bacteria